MGGDRYHRNLLLILTARFIEREFGEGALDALVEWRRNKIKERWREVAEESGRSDPEYLFRLFDEDVHDFEVIRKSRKALEVKVTRCAHAEQFKQFNAMNVGMKMICEGDYSVVQGFNPRIKFRRPETLMAGDKCCHFIFELQ